MRNGASIHQVFERHRSVRTWAENIARRRVHVRLEKRKCTLREKVTRHTASHERELGSWDSCISLRAR
jgi:hypothetical protein